MANITLSIPDDIIIRGREYAKKHHTSLNAIIRNLLQKTVSKPASGNWLTECFHLMDKAKAKKPLGRFKRDELYDV